jgi:hypothetical protein
MKSSFHVDQPLLHGAVEHRAVIQRVGPLVGPGVAVRVEVDQCQRRAMALGMRPQQRIGDEVVATERQHRGVVLYDLSGMGLDRRHDRRWTVMVEPAIAVIDHREPLAGAEAPGVEFLVELGRGRADGRRTEPRARPVGRGQVERHAGHGHVDTRQLAGIAAPHEGQHTAVGVLGLVATQ